MFTFDLDDFLANTLPQPYIFPEPPTVPFEIGEIAHLFVAYEDVDEDEMPWANPHCMIPHPIITEPVTIMFRVHYADIDDYEYIVKTAHDEYKWVSHVMLYR